MLMKKDRKPSGIQFEELYKSAGLKPASIAKMLKTSPQLVNSWRWRGVPATYAIALADLLKCSPDEISDVRGLIEAPPSVGESADGSMDESFAAQLVRQNEQILHQLQRIADRLDQASTPKGSSVVDHFKNLPAAPIEAIEALKVLVNLGGEIQKQDSDQMVPVSKKTKTKSKVKT